VTGTGVIELGEVRHEPPEPTPEPGWSPAARRWFAALVGLATLGVTLGAAAPLPHPLAEATIPAALGDLAFGEGDTYYVIDGSHGRPAGTRTIAAYALPDARLRWRAPLPITGAVRGVGAAEGQMLVSTHPNLLESVETIAVGEDTGRVMWRRRAQFEGVTPERGNVLLWTAPNGVPAAGTGREALEAVEPGTAAVRWSYRVPVGGWLAYRYHNQRPVRVVTLLPSGRVEVRELEHGHLIAAADGLLPPRRPAEPSRYVQLAGDLLLVRQDRKVVTAYGLGRLERRWSAEVDPSTEFVSTDCGATLCVLSRLGGLRVLDPATGQTRWLKPGWSNPRRVGDRLVVNQTDRRPGRGPLVVADPATGRQLGVLGEWLPLGPARPDGRLPGVRIDLSTLRAWFAWLDPVTLSVRVIQAAADIIGDCEARADAILCRRLDASVGVWRLT
jgi:outer membrane protein assembly factor BamB